MPTPGLEFFEGIISEAAAVPSPQIEEGEHLLTKIYNAAIPTCVKLEENNRSIQIGLYRKKMLEKVIKHIRIGRAVGAENTQICELARRIQGIMNLISDHNQTARTNIFDLAGKDQSNTIQYIKSTWDKTLDIERQKNQEQHAEIQKSFDLFLQLLKDEAERYRTIARNM